MNEVRVDIKVGKEFEKLITFLTFHQFPFKLCEEKIFNVEKLLKTKEQFLLIENDKVEEFRVLYRIFKNLKVNSVVIENKPVIEKKSTGDDRTLRLIKEELLSEDIEDLEAEQKEESPFQFRKEEEKENQYKSLEEVFYGKKSNKEEKKQKIAKQERSNGFSILLLLVWIIVVVILALKFVLIR